MKRITFPFIFIMLLLAACGKKENSLSNEEKIAGESEKTWKATKQTDAQGDKDKLTRQEKRETIIFSRSGNVKMGNQDQMMGGTWSYLNNTLSLQFAGANNTENFEVLELTEDVMRLKAEDGSELTMKPD